jgi:hypothetical protein
LAASGAVVLFWNFGINHRTYAKMANLRKVRLKRLKMQILKAHKAGFA